jgi:hypothetical protein
MDINEFSLGQIIGSVNQPKSITYVITAINKDEHTIDVVSNDTDKFLYEDCNPDNFYPIERNKQRVLMWRDDDVHQVVAVLDESYLVELAIRRHMLEDWEREDAGNVVISKSNDDIPIYSIDGESGVWFIETVETWA